MKKLLTSVGISAVLLSATSVQAVAAHDSHYDAKECEVLLNYDVTVEPKKLIISEVGDEKYRIEMDQLFVNGQQVNLNKKQQALVSQYSESVSGQVPEVIAVVNDAVSIASTAVSLALTPLLGDSAGAQIDEMMAGLEERIEKVAYQHGDTFYLGATESSLEDAFGEEFEKEMEQLIQNSLGSMMMSLGAQMMSGDGDSFEQKMASFSAKMDSVGEEIEMQIEQQADDLEARGEVLCNNFKSLIVLEKQLRSAVPELANYPLLETGNKTLLE
ncbi:MULTISPECIES: YggN family protein [Shewanella]|uniref:YggN family protein n=1 Tax=Shewanella fidelis TaxID=173509 RepID=A0AAW8NN73_9GAMM|nr:MULTISPECIES: YggN family protein [Shewanella]MDR8524699.1 YggN family protein [Shewanella fidelis]MDW4812174.1 YggN family protein [Shewanella fidelis]MDW4817370.1 YggN family protein [Shewanella fidelis]MDW4821438.1 YggN family protein [Shewanella fidelis]MDW4822781.1 YggN family protein [Shewanella fidelis]